MLYKVYAKNCIRPKGMRIIEASKNDLENVYFQIIDEAVDFGSIDIFADDEVDDNKYSAAYEKCEEYFKAHNKISAGDYMIVNAESLEEISIPNVCYSDASNIF